MESMQALREAIDGAVAGLVARAREDPSLAREYERSLAEFFLGTPTPTDPRAALLAARRHAEWFLLERPGDELDVPPLEELIEVEQQRGGDAAVALVAVLRGSFAGIFRVAAVAPGEGVVLEDLAGLGSYACGEAEASYSLAVGDLIVGRLHPIGGDVHVISPAAGFVRDTALAEAVERDLDRMRGERIGKVLRISQREIERLFFGAGSAGVAGGPGSTGSTGLDAGTSASADPVGELRRMLAEAGIAPERVEQTLARLAATPRDDFRWAHGAGDVLGEVLDELAFETEVDLDAARLTMLRAWSAMRADARLGSAAAPAAAPERERHERRDARAALAEFEQSRRSGGDLEQAFAKLERDLGLAGDGGSEASSLDDAGVAELSSVVPALIEEFLWDRGRRREGQPPPAALRRALEALSTYGSGLETIEALDECALLRFLTFWIFEHDALDEGPGAPEALELLEAVALFCRWLEEQHDLPLWTALRPRLTSLRRTLPRMARANRERARDHGLGANVVGELFEVVSIDRDARVSLLGRDGTSRSARLAPNLVRHLAVGDRLRAHAGHESIVLLCCYPPEIAELLAT